MRARWLGLLLLWFTPVLPAAEIRLVGSDLLGREFALSLAEFARQREIPLRLDLEGSRAALTALRDNRAELGLVVLPPAESPPSAPWHSVPLAYHTTVVLVASDCPLSHLTFSQLGGIFGTTAPTSLNRWSQLGLEGEWALRNISAHALTAAAVFPTELFRHTVLRGGPLKPAVQMHETLAILRSKLAEDSGGIALAPAVPAAPPVLRALPLARSDNDPAFSLTPQNIHAGDYPLRLPLWLVVRPGAAKPALEILRHLLGDEIAAILARAQLTPVPREARKLTALQAEQW